MIEVLASQQFQNEEGVTFHNIRLKIPSVNALTSRQRARAWVRRNYPTARPPIEVENKQSLGTVQTRFSSLFPESIRRVNFEVSVRFRT